VAAAINTMLTGAWPTGDGRAPSDGLEPNKNARNVQQFIAGGQSALPQDSMGKPWNGDYVFASGDLVEDLTHNFFLETGGAQQQAQGLRDGRSSGGAGADRIPPRPRRLAPGRLRAGGRAPHWGRPDEDVSQSADPHGQDPGVPAAHPEGRAPQALPLLPAGLREIIAVFNGPHPETGEDLEVVDEAPEGFAPVDLPSQPAVFAPDYAPEEIEEIARKLRKAAGLPTEPTGVVAEGSGGLVGKVKYKLT
jgi:hypothetical protein